jgi:hypothetical protein
MVAPEIPNPNETLEDTRVLAQIWDLYGNDLTKKSIDMFN